VSRLSLYTVDDKSKLFQRADGLWKPSGKAEEKQAGEAELVQGALEHSNVNPVELTTELIETKRAYAAYLKTMKAFSEMTEKAGQLGQIG
ncbi:MAG: flagellar basal body rod C-terminal domain-containing protein, partial [Desulfosalsimonadaceae bacterium]